jgi:primosomal replication protein N
VARSHRKSAACATTRNCSRTSHRRSPRPAVRADCADRQQQRHDQAHHAVAVAAADRVTDRGGAAAADQDRDGQHRDPPRHQPRPLAVVVGDLGRHGDVGDLEERVRRRAPHERDQHPSGVEPLRAEIRYCEQQREAGRQRQATAKQERPARPEWRLVPIADPAGDRVEHHVEGFRQQHDRTGEHGRDAERVGQIGEQ